MVRNSAIEVRPWNVKRRCPYRGTSRFSSAVSVLAARSSFRTESTRTSQTRWVMVVRCVPKESSRWYSSAAEFAFDGHLRALGEGAGDTGQDRDVGCVGEPGLGSPEDPRRTSEVRFHRLGAECGAVSTTDPASRRPRPG